MTDAKQLLLDDGMAIDQRKTAGRVRNFFEHDFESSKASIRLPILSKNIRLKNLF